MKNLACADGKENMKSTSDIPQIQLEKLHVGENHSPLSPLWRYLLEL